MLSLLLAAALAGPIGRTVPPPAGLPDEPAPAAAPTPAAVYLPPIGNSHHFEGEGSPTPTVCLTELWESYDYDYETDEDGSYAELVTWAWTVETRGDLPGGVACWRYLGMIRATRVLWYDSDEEETAAWWSTGDNHGQEAAVQTALRRMLDAAGDRREPAILWR